MPGEDNDFTVMWDYNVGLVRMTPFFKCCKYSKVGLINSKMGTLLIGTDCSGKDVEPQPWSQGHHAQYHGRRNSSSR